MGTVSHNIRTRPHVGKQQVDLSVQAQILTKKVRIYLRHVGFPLNFPETGTWGLMERPFTRGHQLENPTKDDFQEHGQSEPGRFGANPRNHQPPKEI